MLTALSVGICVSQVRVHSGFDQRLTSTSNAICHSALFHSSKAFLHRDKVTTLVSRVYAAVNVWTVTGGRKHCRPVSRSVVHGLVNKISTPPQLIPGRTPTTPPPRAPPPRVRARSRVAQSTRIVIERSRAGTKRGGKGSYNGRCGHVFLYPRGYLPSASYQVGQDAQRGLT